MAVLIYRILGAPDPKHARPRIEWIKLRQRSTDFMATPNRRIEQVISAPFDWSDTAANKPRPKYHQRRRRKHKDIHETSQCARIERVQRWTFARKSRPQPINRHQRPPQLRVPWAADPMSNTLRVGAFIRVSIGLIFCLGFRMHRRPLSTNNSSRNESAPKALAAGIWSTLELIKWSAVPALHLSSVRT